MIGCSRTSPPGGPGADNKKDNKLTTTTSSTTDKGSTTTSSTSTSNTNDSSNTFEIKVPSSTNVTQGSSNPEDVSISRGRNFKQAVKLTLKSVDADIKVTPDSYELKPYDSKASFNVQANDNAKVGAHVIEVTGTPAEGKPTSINWSINVKQK